MVDILSLEHRIHDLVNQERVQNGLDAIEFDDDLARVARGHSEDMANRLYFCHESPEGKNPFQRGEEQGVPVMAENIAQNDTREGDYNALDNIATLVVGGWMNSPGHRMNILTFSYKKEGIGVAQVPGGNILLVTENFA